MTDIDSEIAALKTRISAAQLTKVKLEVSKESAESTLAQAMQRLKDEYGVDSLDDVRAKLMQLHSELQIKVQEVTHILDSNNL